MANARRRRKNCCGNGAQGEYDEMCAAIRQGIAQMEAGLCIPAENVFADLCRKYGIADS